MEGIAYKDFIEFVNKHNESAGIKIITENLDNIIVKNFLSCIVYVFMSAGENVCIVQFKTTAASDKWSELEASGLTTGNTIFYFDDNDGGNCLMSIICADALNQINTQFNKTLNYNKYLLLHPQLNPKPLHDSFRHMRKNLMSFSFRNIRILTQNWSKHSQLIIEDTGEVIEIEESYSACYYCENDNIDVLYKKNKSKGVDLAKEDHVFIWHMPDEEHCVFYFIDSYGLNGINPSASRHEEPLVKLCMLYDTESEKWLSVTGCKVCSIDWEWLENQFELKQ